MRLGVLDVGSNTVHLLVVDGERGAALEPIRKHKSELHLSEVIGPDGRLGDHGRSRLVEAVGAAAAAAAEEGVDDLLSFATSAVREATDSAEVIATIREQTGVDLMVLPGEDEAAMTFLAVRRWFGWSAGRMLCLDIGGGSLEIATGPDEGPELALSVPLGAGRLTRTWLPSDLPSEAEVDALRLHLREQLAPVAQQIATTGEHQRAVATSKTFRSLARIGGAAPSTAGPLTRRSLSRRGLDEVVEVVSHTPVQRRHELPGVSPGRAPQLLAGALVAQEAFEAFGIDRVELCPWALREGVVLRRLDWLNGAEG